VVAMTTMAIVVVTTTTTTMTVPPGGRRTIEEQDDSPLPLATSPLHPSSSLDPSRTGWKREGMGRLTEEGAVGEEERMGDERSAGVSCSHFSREKISMASGGRVRRREYGLPFHCTRSALTPPKFPRPLPPYSTASLLSTSL
jgi:hypothetical protein